MNTSAGANEWEVPLPKTMSLTLLGLAIAAAYSLSPGKGWIAQMQFSQFLLVVHIVPFCTMLWRGGGFLYPRSSELWRLRLAAAAIYSCSIVLLAYATASLGPLTFRNADTIFYGGIGLILAGLIITTALRDSHDK